MKALFIGMGSAGQRHMRNLLQITEGKAEIGAYRKRKLQRVFDDSLHIIPDKTLTQAYPVQEFECIEDIIKFSPNIVFITNPNSMHINHAITMAGLGYDIFIEKPVSDKMDGIDQLIEIMKEKGNIVYIGYQMRKHPCLLKLKETINLDRLGNIVSVNCEIGELLPNMHQYEDYRDMNESRRQMGGGVTICQIHEFDYLSWIFGTPDSVYSIGGKYSDMEIDVEDSITSLLRYKGNELPFAAVVHQDFLQSPPVRKCKVVGTLGSMEVDLLKNHYLITYKDGTKEEKEFSDFVRNDMFMQELKDFLACTITRETPAVNLDSGLVSLQIALAAKESMVTGNIMLIKKGNIYGREESA